MVATPVRLQLSRRAGFKLQAESWMRNGLQAVSVARPSIWGNPFRVGVTSGIRTPEMAVRFFEQSIHGNWSPSLVASMPDHIAEHIYFVHCEHTPAGRNNKVDIVHFVRANLRGKNLACWCPLDRPCHAAVLLEIANS